MKFIKNNTDKYFSLFFCLILLTILGIIVSIVYNKNKEDLAKQIQGSLDNIYLKKTIQEITKNLNPRYTKVNYISKAGDTYQNIIDKLIINKKEKNLLLKMKLIKKSLKILRINQKFKFKLDNLSKEKILEFKIQTDSKNEIIL